MGNQIPVFQPVLQEVSVYVKGLGLLISLTALVSEIKKLAEGMCCEGGTATRSEPEQDGPAPVSILL